MATPPPPITPPSPTFATSSSGFLRPEYSAVSLPSGSTSPTSTPPASPPHSRSTTPVPEFSDKYGGYGSGSPAHAGAPLLGAAAGTKSSSSRHRKPRNSPIVVLLKLIAILCAITGAVALLARLAIIPSPRDHVAHHLGPFIPASVVNLLGPTSLGPAAAHPILPLIAKANSEWNTMLAGQSVTFDRASKTYNRRYNLTPPPGFDKWFAFATQGRNHSLVDEYDSLMDDLLPFRSLTPGELRRRTAELAQVPGVSIVSIRDGVAQIHSKSGKWAPALAFQQMLGAFVRDLPDMDIAINEKAEGRVLPRQQRKVSMADYGLEGMDELATNASDPMINPSLKGFTAEWKRDGSVWEAFRRSCPTDAASRRLVESLRSAETSSGGLVVRGRSSSKADAPLTRRVQKGQAFPPTRELTFSDDIDANYDICARPSMHTLHSTFFSDQRSIEYLYPVFSPSKPSGFADILIPSHYYWEPSTEFTYEWEMKKGRTHTPTDLDWDQKNSTIYWRGKVTRGADTPPGHGSSFQKQRLVKATNQLALGQDQVLVSFVPKSASLVSTAAPVREINSLTSDIAMACDPNLGECSYLRSLGYRVEPPAPMSDAWKHKYVLDLDEIGFSPRFFALMESKSAVVKSSVQREFWKGWIKPWKHYIPLSSAYSELHNIQTFFSGFPSHLSGTSNQSRVFTELTKPYTIPELPVMSDGTPFEGDRALRDIAEAGTEWRNRFVRKADMECYVYRLMIEWAAMVTTKVAEPEVL